MPRLGSASGPDGLPTVVAGYESSPGAQAAVVAAADTAISLTARLVVVHAVTVADYPIDPDAADWDEHAGRELAAQRLRVAVLLAGHPVEWSYRTRRGSPWSVLAACAVELDAVFIVVGAPRAGTAAMLRRLAGESVAHRLIGCCDRPVLLVPARGPRVDRP